MSFRKLPPALRSPLSYSIAVAALFAILAGELWLSVRQLSQTADEAAHLYSGYQYWKARDYGLNPEHPPILKLVAAVPLLTLRLNRPHPPTFSSKVEEYVGGGQLLYGNDADRLLWRARIAASIFTFLLAAIVFAAAYEMFGPLTALIALLLCVFEPTLLAHGALVTTDMIATCTIFGAVYVLYRYVKQRSLPRLLLVGLAVGFATAAKFSSLVLLPTFVACLIVEWLIERRSVSRDTAPPSKFTSSTGSWSLVSGWIATLVVAWIVLWAFYGFTYQARPGSAQLAPTLPVYAGQLRHAWETSLILALARLHLLPESYLYGLVDLQIFGRQLPSFVLGKVYPGATKMYFPIAFVIKSTLPVLLLLAALPFLLVRSYKRFSTELTFLTIPIVVFFAVNMNAPENIGVRHIMPVFPFVLLLASLAAFLMATRSRTGAIVACALLVFHAVSSLHAFPTYIPYSNEIFGGPSHTYRVLADSNTDWGQGVKETRAYLETNHVTDCWFSAGIASSSLPYYHINCQPLPSGFVRMVGFPLQVIPPIVHGTVLVSSTEASGLFWGSDALNPYAELLRRKPDAMIGNVVLVFRGDLNLSLASAQTHSNAASFLLKQYKLPEALAEAQIAMALAPKAPDIQVTLGTILLKMNRKAEAAQAFADARVSARKLDPRDILRTEEVVAALQR